MKAHTPAFHQPNAMTGSLLGVTAGRSIQATTSSQTSVLRKPSRRAAAPSAETPASPLSHLVDESSPSEEGLIPLKRMRVEVSDGASGAEESTRGDPELSMAASESAVDLVTMASQPVEVVEDAPLPEVIVEEEGLPEAT